MANMATLLKTEVSRLARKEIKAAVTPVLAALNKAKKEIVGLKRKQAELERSVCRKGRTAASSTIKGTADATETGAPTGRFSAKGFRSWRTKHRLTLGDAALLVGVSQNCVYYWESGRTTPREAQLSSIAAARALGKREIAARLDDAKKPKKKADNAKKPSKKVTKKPTPATRRKKA